MRTKTAELKNFAASLLAVFLPILFFCGSGCESKREARFQAQQAFVAGQEQALAQSKAKSAVVTFNGPVENSTVEWTEDLTLAKALVQANYTGYLRPRLIRVSRDGQTFEVKPGDLLQGQDMPLQAGDVVDVIP